MGTGSAAAPMTNRALWWQTVTVVTVAVDNFTSAKWVCIFYHILHIPFCMCIFWHLCNIYIYIYIYIYIAYFWIFLHVNAYRCKQDIFVVPLHNFAYLYFYIFKHVIIFANMCIVLFHDYFCKHVHILFLHILTFEYIAYIELAYFLHIEYFIFFFIFGTAFLHTSAVVLSCTSAYSNI